LDALQRVPTFRFSQAALDERQRSLDALQRVPTFNFSHVTLDEKPGFRHALQRVPSSMILKNRWLTHFLPFREGKSSPLC
jgi:hypothetical protein